MQLRIKRTQLHIDWLMLLFPIIAAALGQKRQTMLLFLSLTAHEAAHFLAAHAMKVSFHSLRLTPFGGMSQIENPYSISALQLSIVSAAGPVADLLLILLTASLAYWHYIDFHIAKELIHINTLLMLFNLLPALPLDGGRILYALLSPIITRRRAMQTGILLGRVLAGMLIVFAFWGLIQQGTLNLSPVFAALFLIVSAEDERRALTDSRLHTLLNSLAPLRKPTKAQIIAIDAATPPEAALQTASPNQITLFAVFDNGRFLQFIDDRTLLVRIIHDSDKKIDKI